ncbi:hypothetical protein B0H14DRAFT_3126136, partial [Mycena olivaceomarginata]
MYPRPKFRKELGPAPRPLAQENSDLLGIPATVSGCPISPSYLHHGFLCDILYQAAFDLHQPKIRKSLVSLGWILSNGIQAPQSVASGVLTIPTGGTVCSMHVKLSLCSELPYDLVLGRDWLFFSRQTLPQTSFTLSSGVVCPGNFRTPSLLSSAMDTDPQVGDYIGNMRTEFLRDQCVCDPLICRCPSTSASMLSNVPISSDVPMPSALPMQSDVPMPAVTSLNIIRSR